MRDDDVVLGIDFGGSKTALACADPSGALLSQRVLPLRSEQPGEETLVEALRGAMALVEEDVTSGRCVGVGVSTPGIPAEAGTLLSPNLSGWDRIPLAERVGEALGVAEVAVGNDVKCAARAELRWGALRGTDPAVYLNLGTGIAAAVVVGGQVLEGAHGAAGEIGYGYPASRERPTQLCLEELAGGGGLARRASELFGESATAERLFDSDEPAARRLVEEALQGLAAYLSEVVLLLDPARIVVGGGLMARAERVLPVLRAGLSVPRPIGPEIVAARFPSDASLRGAIASILERLAGDGAASPAISAVTVAPGAREGNAHEEAGHP